ncbi:MAG TPA: sugar-binding protein [Chthonomonadaceae bacterium]|nr:sugar-binding protein [Chthonomonadaceae bacterium]
MKRFPLLAGPALLAWFLIGAGCSQPKGSGNPANSSSGSSGGQTIAGAPTYRIITNGISPFWDSMVKGMNDAKADVKCNADWQGPDPADHNTQVRMFNDAVAANVNGIAISAIEADAIVPTINSAIDKGIPVITFDSDSPKSKRLAYLGTNNYEAGRTAGLEAVKLFPNGGKLIAFVGNMSAQNARERYDGFKAGAQGHNITFLADPYEDNKDKGRARQNVEQAIAKFGDQINGFVGLYSYNGPAILEAVQSAGIRNKVKIICFDGEPETLDALSKGLVDLTVVQKPYEFGRLSIYLLNDINKDKDIDKALNDLQPELDNLHMKRNGRIIDTGVEVITPANAAPFIQRLKERGLTST